MQLGNVCYNLYVGVQAVTSIATINGALYFGIYSPKGDADVLKWTGCCYFLALDAADAAGTYSVNGASVAGFSIYLTVLTEI